MNSTKPKREELLRLCKGILADPLGWEADTYVLIARALQETLQPSPAPEPTMQEQSRPLDMMEADRVLGFDVSPTPQAAVTEDAQEKVIALFDDMHNEAAEKGTPYNVEKFSAAVVSYFLGKPQGGE